MTCEHKINLKSVATFVVAMTLVLVLVQMITCRHGYLVLVFSAFSASSVHLFSTI